jgi:catechol 2,3-dioxygenase-like lactoylglutathione lyase family enzyme
MPITLGQVAVASHDLDADLKFYRDLLLLPVLDFRPDSPILIVLLGESRLFVSTPESSDFDARPVLYLRVQDLDAEWARLMAAGAEPLSEPHLVHRDERTELRMGFIHDPAGTPLGLMSEGSVD